jgi:hypothetical protein
MNTINQIIHNICYITGLNIDQVENILYGGILDWYEWVKENQCSHTRYLQEEAKVMGITLDSILDVESRLTTKDLKLINEEGDQFIDALYSGIIPDSLANRIAKFVTAVDLTEDTTNESRDNILMVVQALYDLDGSQTQT